MLRVFFDILRTIISYVCDDCMKYMEKSVIYNYGRTQCYTGAWLCTRHITVMAARTRCDRNKRLRQQQQVVHWQPPSIGFVKCNLDAATCMTNNKVGCES
jgi:hypothetical protein